MYRNDMPRFAGQRRATQYCTGARHLQREGNLFEIRVVLRINLSFDIYTIFIRVACGHTIRVGSIMVLNRAIAGKLIFNCIYYKEQYAQVSCWNEKSS